MQHRANCPYDKWVLVNEDEGLSLGRNWEREDL